MKIYFKNYYNQLLAVREVFENFVFNIIAFILYSLILNNNIDLITSLKIFFNFDFVLTLIIIAFTFLLTSNTKTLYLNRFYVSALNLTKWKVKLFHFCKILLVSFLIGGTLLWTLPVQSKFYIIGLIMYNALLLIFYNKNVLTFIIYVLSTFLLSVLVFCLHSNYFVIIIALLVCLCLMILTNKFNLQWIKKQQNKLMFLPKNLFFETFVLVFRNAKITKWVLIFLVMTLYYWAVPYHKHFEAARWLTQHSDFKLPNNIDLPLVLILLYFLHLVLVFKIIFANFKQKQKYQIINKKYKLYKYITTLILLNFVILIFSINMYHSDIAIIKQFIPTNIHIDFNMNVVVYIMPLFLLSLLSTIEFKLNMLLKLILFISCESVFTSFDVLHFFNWNYSQIIFWIGFIVVIYTLIKKEKKDDWIC